MKRILLCCGSGASSGFMANNAMAAARPRGMEMSVQGCSVSEVEDYLHEVDLVMLGPHFQHRVEAIRDIADEYGVPVDLIDGNVYGSLDGKGLLEQALKSL